jgi:hypothetical protein
MAATERQDDVTVDDLTAVVDDESADGVADVHALVHEAVDAAAELATRRGHRDCRRNARQHSPDVPDGVAHAHRVRAALRQELNLGPQQPVHILGLLHAYMHTHALTPIHNNTRQHTTAHDGTQRGPQRKQHVADGRTFAFNASLSKNSLKACSMAAQRASPPTIVPAAYLSPRRRTGAITGSRLEKPTLCASDPSLSYCTAVDAPLTATPRHATPRRTTTTKFGRARATHPR